jgi:hypothetical protein
MSPHRNCLSVCLFCGACHVLSKRSTYAAGFAVRFGDDLPSPAAPGFFPTSILEQENTMIVLYTGREDRTSHHHKLPLLNLLSGIYVPFPPPNTASRRQHAGVVILTMVLRQGETGGGRRPRSSSSSSSNSNANNRIKASVTLYQQQVRRG